MASTKPRRIKPLVVAIITSLFIAICANVSLGASFAEGSLDENFPCNCVIFRIDDVSDGSRAMPAIAVMDAFISRNQDLSLGIVMNNFGNNSQLLNKVAEGRNKGLFELDIHGWNHADYSALSRDVQISTIAAAKNKMYKLFGESPSVFIPPFNRFNDDTIKAMVHSNLTILSSDTTHDSGRYFVADGNYRDLQAEASSAQTQALTKTAVIGGGSIGSGGGGGGGGEGQEGSLIHMPAAAYFGVVDSNEKTWENLPETQILSQTKLSIAKYGYAVILLHPQSYLLTKGGRSTNLLDNTAISELYGLIDSLKAQNMHITTFGKAVRFRPQVSVLHAKLAGEDYVVTGKSSYVKVTTVSIIPKRYLQVDVEGQGKLEITLPKSMIDDIYSVRFVAAPNAKGGTNNNSSGINSNNKVFDKEIQFQHEDTGKATVISFNVPSDEQSFSIAGASVVPELSAPLQAIAVATVLYLVVATTSKRFQLRRSCP
jgi:peptidoglycan/xylan/chitin deacetylase (PgdA/CDA1 family)